MGDRAFRGFGHVVSIGPSETYPNEGVARAAGSDAGAVVTLGDFTTQALGGSHPQAATFTSFFQLVGSSPEASEIFLAFPIASESEIFEGAATPRILRTERVFDLYGNPKLEFALGDVADPSDDVATVIEYAIRDDGQVLLANRPMHVTMSGSSGPPGTTLEREARIFYDGKATLGDAVRGNPTRVERRWGSAWVAQTRAFDVYGNPIEVSSPFEVGSADPVTLTRFTYDLASQTFLTGVTAAYGTPLALTTTLEYDLGGCGPIGLGLVCRTTDPNGEQSTAQYDRFGRLSASAGPNGFQSAADYHDGDRATASQRREVRLRWDPNAGSPASDPQAIALLTYFDGLGRPLVETRPGPGSTVAERETTYDAAGRVATRSQWGFGGPGPVTSFAYDALGNLRRKDDTGQATDLAQFVYDDPDSPHAPTEVRDAQGLLQIEYGYDAAGNVIQKRRRQPNGSYVTGMLSHDAFGRATQVADASTSLGLGCSALDRRVRLTQTGTDTLLYPEPGFEYLVGEARVHKHVFLAGRRIASSARTWTAPSAGASPLLAWRGPQLPAPAPWALGLAWGGAMAALLVLAARRRREPGAAPLPLRLASVVTVGLASPALVASSCQPGTPPLGTHNFAALLYATDHLGSTLVTVQQNATAASRFVYRPYGNTVVVEGTPVHHRFAGAERDPTRFDVLGARLYDPETARFLMPDALVPDASDPQAFNRYAYALGSPTSLVDPSGNAPRCPDENECGGGGGFGVAG